MDISIYDLEDLLLSAIKSEVDSGSLYSTLAKSVKNGFMIDKFQFLANEEKKHQTYLEDLFKSEFPDKSLEIPSSSPVPMPNVIIPKDEKIPVSSILTQAIDAEQAAHDFYLQLADQFKKTDIKNMLHYFADMELGHLHLLEQEKQSMEWFEQADVYLPMVHAGP